MWVKRRRIKKWQKFKGKFAKEKKKKRKNIVKNKK